MGKAGILLVAELYMLLLLLLLLLLLEKVDVEVN